MPAHAVKCKTMQVKTLQHLLPNNNAWYGSSDGCESEVRICTDAYESLNNGLELHAECIELAMKWYV